MQGGRKRATAQVPASAATRRWSALILIPPRQHVDPIACTGDALSGWEAVRYLGIDEHLGVDAADLALDGQ